MQSKVGNILRTWLIDDKVCILQLFPNKAFYFENFSKRHKNLHYKENYLKNQWSQN